MSDKPLNARERAYLQPAIVYGWQIEIWPARSGGFWDGDSMMPVRIGPLADSLIKRGDLEKNVLGLRITAKAKAYECRECQKGYLYDINDNRVGPCPHCQKGVAVNPTGGAK